jgi:hypothetical protein
MSVARRQIDVSDVSDDVATVQLDGLAQRDLERLEQFRPGLFLAVDARHLFDPPDPPGARLLDHGGMGLGHRGGCPGMARKAGWPPAPRRALRRVA